MINEERILYFNNTRIYKSLNINDPSSNMIKLELTIDEWKAYQSRLNRYFNTKYDKEEIFKEIDDAGFYYELENLTKKYSICDLCNLKNTNLYASKRILKAIVNSLYEYPKLRGRLSYIGSHFGYENIIKKIKNSSFDIIKELNLEEVSNIVIRLSTIIDELFQMQNSENYLATSIDTLGFIDGILLDQNDYDEYKYISLFDELMVAERVGYHPNKCDGQEYVIYHEIGHLLDQICNLSSDLRFNEYVDTLKVDVIQNELSKYSSNSKKEMIAEAFAECCCNPSPRLIARTIKELLDNKYLELFEKK